MSKYTEIFEYMRTCPALKNLWSIAAVEENGVSVILPRGASATVQYQEKLDVLGNYQCNIEPYPSVYEDYQINCYRLYDTKEDAEPSANYNVLRLEEVQGICDWVTEQNEIGNLPNITGRQVVSIECNPFVPQIRYINDTENIIAYFITIRIRYVNPTRRKWVEYDGIED